MHSNGSLFCVLERAVKGQDVLQLVTSSHATILAFPAALSPARPHHDTGCLFKLHRTPAVGAWRGRGCCAGHYALAADGEASKKIWLLMY